MAFSCEIRCSYRSSLLVSWVTEVDSCRFRGELWQITHSHVGQSQQRREGAQHQTVGGHQPKQAFVVDIGRGLLIEPDHVLAGALKLAASLVVGLEAEIRGAAGLVLDKHGVDGVGGARSSCRITK